MPHLVSTNSDPIPIADSTHASTAMDDGGDKPGDAPVEQAPDGDVDMNAPDAVAPEQNGDAPAPEPAKKEVKLEELFDVESDNEFPSSAPVKNELSSSPPRMPSPSDLQSLKASDPEVMRSFYQRLFPWRQLFYWLNHSLTPTNDFAHREIAFSLPNDVYLRYQSYTTADLLRKDVLRLMPSRFEIGPVYSTNPRDRKTLRNSSAFKPIAKELCFDIDLTDYDDIRTCCADKTICNKCWAFITMAIKVIDVALREDFGFRHIMWVYSGRRGAHAWICDKKARSLDDSKRKAIAGYFDLGRGGGEGGKRVNIRRPLHPHVSRSLDILKTHFQQDILEVQDPWSSNERADKLLQLLPDKELKDSLRRKWDAAPDRASFAKWSDIDAMAKTGASKSLDRKALLEAKQDIVLEYTYPRLDINVSKKLNHLLKSPFVVHPGTGRVCVPIDTRNLDDFDPLGVPTVQSLLAEIDAWEDDGRGDAGEDVKKSPSDWEKTSLKPYVDYFRSFAAGIVKDERDVRVKRERDEESMEF